MFYLNSKCTLWTNSSSLRDLLVRGDMGIHKNSSSVQSLGHRLTVITVVPLTYLMVVWITVFFSCFYEE